VRRTQLYLTDDLWDTLKFHARQEKTTVSELARRAIRERYLGDRQRRAAAMEAFIGIRKDRTDLPESTEEYVRSLRRGTRLRRLWKE
jgi:hypothetical protein